MTILTKKLLYLSTIVFGISLLYVSCGQNNQPFLEPPRVVKNNQGDFAPEKRTFQGIPSLAISPQGRFWATWYAGTGKGEDRQGITCS